MHNNLESFINCPKCETELSVSNDLNYSCISCGSIFKKHENIVDFRDIDNEATKGFSIKDDYDFSKILFNNFDKFKNFNGLIHFYERLKSYKDPNLVYDELINKILVESLEFDLPMTYEQSIHGFDIFKKINLFREEFYFENFDKDVCLENGCGHGLFIEGLSKKFKTLLVVDFSLCYLILAKKICEEKSILNVYLICASVEKLPFKKNSINLIHSNNVIEHVSDQGKMLNEINRIFP